MVRGKAGYRVVRLSGCQGNHRITRQPDNPTTPYKIGGYFRGFASRISSYTPATIVSRFGLDQ